MRRPGYVTQVLCVAPFTGAWIEIRTKQRCPGLVRGSHPSRVRGLKYVRRDNRLTYSPVAPFTGAWIEIMSAPPDVVVVLVVAPFTGAWIEIRRAASSWARCRVAPFTGAWIEM